MDRYRRRSLRGITTSKPVLTDRLDHTDRAVRSAASGYLLRRVQMRGDLWRDYKYSRIALLTYSGDIHGRGRACCSPARRVDDCTAAARLNVRSPLPGVLDF